MDFLTDSERANLENDFSTVFQTMSKGRTIVVVKEPIKTVVDIANPFAASPNNLFGFGQNQSADPIVTYTPVSGIFPAMLMYAPQVSPLDPEINVRVYAGPVSIKVQSDCRDYINDGLTKHIVADSKTFLLDGEEQRQMFLTSTYYIFKLKATT